jgi:hypothetical protein
MADEEMPMRQPKQPSKPAARRPVRSFSDEFPVTAENPPVGRLKIKNRPGRIKVRFKSLGK